MGTVWERCARDALESCAHGVLEFSGYDVWTHFGCAARGVGTVYVWERCVGIGVGLVCVSLIRRFCGRDVRA